MRELSLRETQLILADMLREFAAFCSAYHLEYRLYAGTLLGAVRHKGFIPWDDDVDVTMPRPDYQKLVELASEKEYVEGLPSNLHFNVYKTFLRLYNSNTKTELVAHYPKNAITELWIDILPVDGMPADKNEVRARFKRAKKLIRRANDRVELISSVPPLRSKLLRLVRRPRVMLHPPSYYWQEVESYLTEYPFDESEYVGVTSAYKYTFLPDVVTTRGAYENFVIVEFEGMRLKASSAWDEELAGLYGDYTIPVRDGHHHIKRAFVL